ncbi:MAG: ATP-binding cassette domain-containing protein [Aestuariivirga sp.]
MNVLEARELYRFFHSGEEEVKALRGVDLTLGVGEMIALVGRSGSGKSTLLHCLAGLDEPDGGAVYVMDQLMSRQSEITKTKLRAKYFGVMRQKDNLISHLSVAENMAMVHALTSNSQPSHQQNILDRIGIAKRANSFPAQLSGGELARAGLAVAMVCQPKILLLDEPTGEVDGETEADILKMLGDFQREGGAIVIATHNAAAAKSATSVVKMKDGKISNG